MLKNYFKTAFRNLWRNRGYSALNIGGLAIGMSAGFLILMYVRFEISYDRFHSKSDQIYRLVTNIKTPSDELKVPVIDWNILGELRSEFPEIESGVRVMSTGLDLEYENEQFVEDKAIYADSSFFHIFSFKLLKGNAQTALSRPMQIVLSKSTAIKIFGDHDPMGKTLKIMNGRYSAEVSGVMEDMPANTMFSTDLIVSMSSFTEVIGPWVKESWASFGNMGYVLLNSKTDPKILEAKIPEYVARLHGEQMKESKLLLTYHLEPLSEVYLYSNRGQSPHITNVWVFAVIALFILLIAAINFINLTTARSVERAKEVGIRKVAGAQKEQLAFQFMSESVVICLIAYIIAIGTISAALPFFNSLSGNIVAESIFTRPVYLAQLFAIALLIAILAGIYPAIVLSSFRPAGVLKGKFANGFQGVALRKTLVVGQFAISVALVIGTLVIYNQTNFMRNQDLGFSTDQLLVLKTAGDNGQKLLKNALERDPNVKSVSTSSTVPGGGGERQSALSVIQNSRGLDQSLTLARYQVDEAFIPQFGMTLLAGRNFSDQRSKDSTSAMIINEKAAKLLGFAEPTAALGKKFRQGEREGEIIGVVSDFHAFSLQKEIQPLCLVHSGSDSRLVNVKMSAGHTEKILAKIEKNWHSYFPNTALDYYFLDEFFDRQYRSEERFGKLFLYFSILAIFISCLGLLGLGAYSTLQRRREIGIRKVLGASTAGIVNLISIQFLKLVAISILIASPIAWYAMHRWLQNFAYRVEISWWIFAIAGAGAIAIAWITLCIQAIKAAVANPVKSLRSE